MTRIGTTSLTNTANAYSKNYDRDGQIIVCMAVTLEFDMAEGNVSNTFGKRRSKIRMRQTRMVGHCSVRQDD